MATRSKPGERMKAPASGVRVRMYRQGHGDCFLLAFPGQVGRSRPTVYVLIDCGYKPKSEIHGQKIDVIAKDILAATGGFVDICMVTHEHQDHVNGFRKKKNRKYVFEDLEIGQLWLAWTEDPEDEFANQLRRDYNDQLLGLALAEQKLGAKGQDPETLELITDLLELELGDDEPLAPGEAAAEIRALFEQSQQKQQGLGLDGHAAFALRGITNKRAIKFLADKAKANDGVRYLKPGGEIANLPRGAKARVYALGPPRDEDLLKDLDPKGRRRVSHGGACPAICALRPAAELFRGGPRSCRRGWLPTAPPSPGHTCTWRRTSSTIQGVDFEDRQEMRKFTAEDYLRSVYGPRDGVEQDPSDPMPDGETWRRIDGDWLESAEALALRLNDEVNNTSLVVAFRAAGYGQGSAVHRRCPARQLAVMGGSLMGCAGP